MKKRIFSMALALCMVLTLLPTTALAVPVDPSYKGWGGVSDGGIGFNYGTNGFISITMPTTDNYYTYGTATGGTATETESDVADLPDSGWNWAVQYHTTAVNGAYYTLTLNDFSISSESCTYDGLMFKTHLNLVLNGTNIISFPSGGSALSGYSDDIYTDCDLHISGAGNLTASASSTGINCNDGALTITGGTINASGTGAFSYNGIFGGTSVTITGGTIIATSNKYGIRTYLGTITITGGDVMAVGGTQSLFAEIYEDDPVANADAITVTPSDTTINVYTGSDSKPNLYCAYVEPSDAPLSLAGYLTDSKWQKSFHCLPNTSDQAKWGVASTVIAAPAQESSWLCQGTLADAVSYANAHDGTYIQLKKDVTTSAALEFVSGKTTILDLDNYAIDRGLADASPVENGYVILVNGSLTLKGSSDGKITGGNNSSNYGGGVFVDDGTLTMAGGTITGNKSGGYGGGVYVRSGSTFHMNGGSITGNSAHNYGGGVTVTEGGAISVSGVAKVTANTKDSSASNVYLFNETITVSAALTSGASIGVSADGTPTGYTPIAITGSNSADYSSYFHSDNSSYIIVNSGTGSTQVVQISLPRAAAPISVVKTDCTTSANNDGTITGVTDTMEYKLSTADTYIPVPTDATTITGLTSGTYYVRVKATETVSASEYVTLTIAAVSPAPSNNDYTPPTINIPVIGKADTVNVSATVSGSAASVNNIMADDIAKAAGDGANQPLVIDLTSLGRNIEQVKLTNSSLQNLSDAANDPNSGVIGVTIQLSGAEITLDAKLLTALVEQADGRSLLLNVDEERTSALNTAQKEAVVDMTNPKILDAYFTCGSQRISDFRGGLARITVPYVRQGSGVVLAVYVDDNGQRTEILAEYDEDNKLVTFFAPHFSYYVITETDVCPRDEACPAAKFNDLDLTTWYHDGIHYCVKNGLMDGIGGNLFDPNGITTRGQIVTILWRLEGKPAVNYATTFDDVPVDTWYTEAVRWAASEKIVDGYSTIAFGPMDTITREQLATILWRYAKYKGMDVSVGENTNILSYNDALEVSEWAIPAMQWVCGAGVLQGSDGNLMPTGTAKRCEAAAMLQRYLEE